MAKIIPVLGYATRAAKNNPNYDFLALFSKRSIFNWESNKAKTRRIVGALKQLDKDSNAQEVELTRGFKPSLLNNIKSWKQIPIDSANEADRLSRPTSATDAFLGACMHLLEKTDDFLDAAFAKH